MPEFCITGVERDACGSHKLDKADKVVLEIMGICDDDESIDLIDECVTGSWTGFLWLRFISTIVEIDNGTSENEDGIL